MGLNEANIKAVITAEDKASAVLNGFGKNVDGIAGKIGSALKVVAEGALVATAAITGFATLSLKAYSEHEEQLAQLNQVLATTGKVSQISSKQVEELSMNMERYSGKSHDAIVQGQVLLLQFSQVTNKNLPEMTKAMLDLSQRMGIDTVAAAKQLGISLDDPVKGMTRLRRSGIDFTEAQQEAIKAMEKSGNLAGADALLMKGLEEKVEGAAGAYRNTLPGAIASARASLHDFEETVGGTIAKYLEPLASKAAIALSKIDWSKVIDESITHLKDYWRELDNAWHALDRVYQQIEHYLEPKLEALAHSLEQAFPVFRKFVDEYINPLAEVLAVVAGKSLVWALGLVIDTLNLLIKIATPVFKFLDDHKIVVELLGSAFAALAANMAFTAVFNALSVGFSTLTLITIPKVMASVGSLQTLIASPLAFGVIAVAAAIFALTQIYDAAMKAHQAIDNTKAAIESYKKSSADVHAQLQGDLLSNNPAIRSRAQKALDAGLAGGTDYWRGGSTLVGEQGPEIVNLPRGSQVIPNNKIGGMGTINVNINAGALMGNDVEARKFAQIIQKHLQDAQNMKGMARA